MKIKVMLSEEGHIQARATFMRGKKPIKAMAKVTRTGDNRIDLIECFNQVALRAHALGISPQDTASLRGVEK